MTRVMETGMELIVELLQFICAAFIAVIMLCVKYVMVPLGALMLLMLPIMPICAYVDYRMDPRVRNK
jgi:hypothetical protein